MENNMNAALKKIRHVLESKAFWAPALALCVLYAFCTGFYMPSIWTTNYYSISFFDGFFRRALIGTLLYPFGSLRLNYHFIAIVQLLAGAGALAYAFGKAFAPGHNRLPVWLLLCMLFLSRWGAFFFAMQGHPEYLMYLVALLSLAVKHSALRLVLLTSTVWMHEMAVLTCVPLWFALEYLHFKRQKTAWIGLAACAASLGIIALFLWNPKTGAEYIQTLAATNYTPAYDYLFAITGEAPSARLHWVPWYWHSQSPFPVSEPYLLLLLALTCTLCIGLERPTRLFARTIMLAAALSPLLMGWLGWDVGRWVFLALVNMFVLLAIFLGALRRRALLICMAIAAIFLFSKSAQLPDHKYYRTPGEIVEFAAYLGQRMTSVPIR